MNVVEKQWDKKKKNKTPPEKRKKDTTPPPPTDAPLRILILSLKGEKGGIPSFVILERLGIRILCYLISGGKKGTSQSIPLHLLLRTINGRISTFLSSKGEKNTTSKVKKKNEQLMDHGQKRILPVSAWEGRWFG